MQIAKRILLVLDASGKPFERIWLAIWQCIEFTMPLCCDPCTTGVSSSCVRMPRTQTSLGTKVCA